LEYSRRIVSGEVTLQSPRLWRIAQWRVAYSNQIAQGIGPITGGLLEFAPTGNFLLDHDQRNTLTSVLSLTFVLINSVKRRPNFKLASRDSLATWPRAPHRARGPRSITPPTTRPSEWWTRPIEWLPQSPALAMPEAAERTKGFTVRLHA
jgi:hypothetical protein